MSYHLVYSYCTSNQGTSGGESLRIEASEFHTDIRPATRQFLAAARDFAKKELPFATNITVISWSKLEEV